MGSGLFERIDRIKGKRILKTGMETIVWEKWSNTHKRM
jgi:hypothetical protein